MRVVRVDKFIVDIVHAVGGRLYGILVLFRLCRIGGDERWVTDARARVVGTFQWRYAECEKRLVVEGFAKNLTRAVRKVLIARTPCTAQDEWRHAHSIACDECR